MAQLPGISGSNQGWEPLDHMLPLVYHQSSSEFWFENTVKGLEVLRKEGDAALGAPTPPGVLLETKLQNPQEGGL